ncbi:coenzyme PQQ synthesis protein C family protein [mine drainage metagenome]|uniref:Coenzyme PQQ synthesis protein C family protein n=2 Tax=mine drainage metagenome TaxID=410659 RepID=T0YG45_9ZZZZ
MTTLAEVERRIADRHLLKHPFYTAWSRGELPLETLRSYAGQYYHFEANFPRYVAAAYARLLESRDRRVLLANLTDEEGRSPTHPEMWVDFARGIGARWPARSPPAPMAPTSRLLETYERLTLGPRASPAGALGALYAYERQFPEVAREKSRGLRAHYGVTARSAHEFFRVHTTADVEHARAEREILRHELARGPSAPAAALTGVDQTLSAWWRFLDGFGIAP